MYSANYLDQRLHEKPTKESKEQKKQQQQQQESAIAEAKSSEKELTVYNTMQMEFINMVAHELRTPIQPILGLSEILIYKINDTEQLYLLNAIVRNAKRLQQLVNDILDVTRIESHSFNIMKERFNLRSIITTIIEDMSTTNNEKIVKLLYEPKDIFVNVDKGRITQVICNLLNNALKFTKEGSILIEVEEKKDDIGDSQVKHFVVLKVKDTGIGLDSEILPKLFSKFATKSHHNHEEVGVGLGLFISKNIVEAHGGKIWAENNRNEKGATFHVMLPA
ncbi:MAG TPA: HAMP domain-containing sensor histidine kinase [Nitrososphaeraceae archaeon]|nr:HAMP domain-containing sensor histidine kinase [Nitrososphaeraceae archaeon]